MTYKDPDKQREANKMAMRRNRRRNRSGITEGITGDEVSKEGITEAERDEAIEFMAKTVGEAERAELKEQVNKVYQEFREAKPKRGKDIKCFADLPPAVQNTINMMSRRGGKIDPIDKARRTKTAIHYQTTCFGPQGMGE